MALLVLVELLSLDGCVVRMGAMGCQRVIARQIREQGGDYVLVLKGNQGRMHQDVADLFTQAQATRFAGVAHDYHCSIDKGHGRIAVRECWTITAPDYQQWLDEAGDWTDLGSIVTVVTERRVGGRIIHETCYYLSSLSVTAQAVGAAVRAHWGIENQVQMKTFYCGIKRGLLAYFNIDPCQDPLILVSSEGSVNEFRPSELKIYLGSALRIG